MCAVGIFFESFSNGTAREYDGAYPLLEISTLLVGYESFVNDKCTINDATEAEMQ